MRRAREGRAVVLDVCVPCSDMCCAPLARAGWGDLPGELHREILRLVPLRDATAARGVSPEMRDEVDDVWGAWGIWATAQDRRDGILSCVRCARDDDLDLGPLMVYAFQGSHAHHLASLGLWWLALLVAEGPDINNISWHAAKYRLPDQSPLMVVAQARRPVGRTAEGEMEWAYALGDAEAARAVRAAVAMGANVNRRLRGALLLMSYCAMRGCLEAVKACLEAGAEVDAVQGISTSPEMGASDKMWWTALVRAAHAGHEALLEAGASAKVGPDCLDQTLAAVCAGHPTPGIVRRLAEAGASVDARGYCGTALGSAARRGDIGLMGVLVDLGATVAGNAYGWSAMHEAATGEVVRWLAAHGASVQGDGCEESPLHSACRDGRVDAARVLVELGADVSYRDGASRTPLHLAVGCVGQPEPAAAEVPAELTRLLLAAGADVDAADRYGWTPLHCVAHAICVDLLLGAGADLELRDREGRTPIHAVVTCMRDKAEVVLRMADRGADLVNAGGAPGLVMRKVEELQAQQRHGGRKGSLVRERATRVMDGGAICAAASCGGRLPSLGQARAGVGANDDSATAPLFAGSEGWLTVSRAGREEHCDAIELG